MSVNSAEGEDVGAWGCGCGCVAAGIAMSRVAAINTAIQQCASELGKRGLPSDVSFNVDPCVGRQVSLGNANGGDAESWRARERFPWREREFRFFYLYDTNCEV